MSDLTRRRLFAALAGSGLTFSGFALGMARPALAFSEDQPTVKLQTLHDNACGATASHKELVAEVEKTLGDRYSAAEKQAVVAKLSCPVCGCPLGGLF